MSIDLKTPNWTLVVELDGRTITTTINDALDVLPRGWMPEGARFAVAGTPTAGSFVYVIETAPNDRFAVLERATTAAQAVELRRPTSGWLTAPFEGWIRVVEAPVEIQDADWTELLNGRDPPPKGSSVKNNGAEGVPQGQKPKPKPKETKRS